ncbi:MAG: hypothetical protein WD378_06170 [Egicoccus sp.]
MSSIVQTRPRRLLRLVPLVAGLLLSTAAPAAADPAGPTNYDSTVTSVEPTDAPVDFEVRGGDAFLVMHVDDGVTAEVPGYDGEPYLRFEPDGTVLVNERSPARWLNDDRYGVRETDLPAVADAEAEPVFVPVADGGSYAWHDHRIHFMSPAIPRQVDADAGGEQPVMNWEVPLVVDGQDVVVRGELAWMAGPSAAMTALLVVLALAVGVVVAVLCRPATTGLVALGGVVALGVALTANIGLPAGMDVQSVPVVLGGLALAIAALGAALSRRAEGRDRVRGGLLAGAAGVPLLVWVVLHLGALTRPIFPGPLPTGVVRAAVVLVAAAGLAGLVSLVRSGLAMTSLDAVAADEAG